jgi:hypothetical protein
LIHLDKGGAVYCSSCGKKAEGNFCWSCGAPLAGRADAPAAPAHGVGTPAETHGPAAFDLAEVARSLDARELVARYAAMAPKRMSGEEFLDSFGGPLKAATGGVPISSIASIAQPMYARLGIKTGKERVETVDRPAREAFLALLCSLARNGQAVRALHTATDGCVVEAVLPSDLRSFEGTLLVTLRRADPETEIRASTTVPGQIFDWGKSNAALDALLADVRSIPVTI